MASDSSHRRIPTPPDPKIRLVKVRAKNQCTLPQAMLEALGVHEGEVLRLTVEGRSLRLEPVEAPPGAADALTPGQRYARFVRANARRLVPADVAVETRADALMEPDE